MTHQAPNIYYLGFPEDVGWPLFYPVTIPCIIPQSLLTGCLRSPGSVTALRTTHDGYTVVQFRFQKGEGSEGHCALGKLPSSQDL